VDIDLNAKDILKVNNIFIINRGMNTLITLLNNLKYYPQDGLSFLEINLTLIRYSKDYNAIYDNTDKILSNVTLREIN